MIVKTRYRDIPFEEFSKCAPGPQLSRDFWEHSQRGKPVSIETPAVSPFSTAFICGGPFYAVPGEMSIHFPGTHRAVCPHIAEIGD